MVPNRCEGTTVFEYTQTNVLVIPQALFAMKDVTLVAHHQSSMIFHKCLARDLVDVEFYTNSPCFIYIESGHEVITDSGNETIDLSAGSALFLPPGLNLHSDFVKKTEFLNAYLVFFDDEVIDDYLTRVGNTHGQQAQSSHCLIENAFEFADFFDSIQRGIKDVGYLNIKLQELLHLVAWKAEKLTFHALLSTMKRLPPKRNLVRLLERHDVLHLSVRDLAHISGRSLSSFNRDFKETYKVTPKKWLQERRLARARELLECADMTVTEAALRVGYENPSNFIKAFRLRYGVTPKRIKRAG